MLLKYRIIADHFNKLLSKQNRAYGVFLKKRAAHRAALLLRWMAAPGCHLLLKT
jgi:uncharacterized protein YdiU (UPF0061 family)